MAKNAFFISDVHLTQDASPNGEALLHLIAKAQQECDCFFVLGDLFDWWMGDGPAFIQKFPRITNAFRELTKSGCKLVYFEGNHDMHLNRFWKNELGAQIISDRFKTIYQGVRLHLEHGDLINDKDKNYLLLRRFLRSPLLKFLAYRAPSRLTRKIGEKSSKASRKRSSVYHADPWVRELVRQYAVKVAEVAPFDIMITGHTHFEDDFVFDTSYGQARSINLGAWYDGPRYLSVSRDEIALKKF